MIYTTDYQINKQELLAKLDAYTQKKVPELTQYETNKLSFVFQEGEKILGRIVGEIHWHYLRIELFFVEPNTRGKGVGAALLSKVEEYALTQNCHLVLLETMSFNAPAFYQKHGYQEIGAIQNHPLPGEAHYFMVKKLAS